MAVTPPGNHLGVLLGIVLSAATSFAVSWLILRFSKSDASDAEFDEAKERSKAMKAGK
jgi:PTS system mannitol-specific IIC component